MRKAGLTVLLASTTLLMAGAAHAQYFDYTNSFLPNPVLTTQAGNQINVINDTNTSGSFSGSFGTDIVLANFAAVATSANTGTWSQAVTESVTLTPSDSLGNPLVGDSPVTHTFNLNYSGSLNSSAITTTLSVLPSAKQTYSFADGSVFTLQLNSYTGPSAPDGTGSGSLGGHVNGVLAGVPQFAPEPNAMAMLFGMSTTGVCFVMRRYRRVSKTA